MAAASLGKVPVVVGGAGVVGLAVARAFAKHGYECLVIEKEGHIGTQTSARNSEVVHAGIYYPQNSLKAKLCVEGKQELYKFCKEFNVPHSKCGKLIVANQNQKDQLSSIKIKAEKNGVNDLVFLTRQEVNDMEPEVACESALLSPSTGIVDSHSLMLALQGDAESNGACFSFNTSITGGSINSDGSINLELGDGETLDCDIFINSCGLDACNVATSLRNSPVEGIPKPYYAKGNYYSLQGKSPFSHLIYPIPEKHGLGIHATIDLGGRARFGPDVEWVTNHEDYSVEPSRSDNFYEAIRNYYPSLPDGSLVPDYSGIRPKINGPNEAAKDFEIMGPSFHGIKGLVHLLGIESPGLTASLAIAKAVLQVYKEEKS